MARGSPTTMPAKISSDMPLPMPRAVICSPSHMIKTAPAVSVSTVFRTNAGPGLATMFGCLCKATAMPNDWKALSPTVSQRVYSVILRRPSSPSFWSFSRVGETTPSNWRMIEAVMYGMIPRANIVKRLKLPPENIDSSPSSPAPIWPKNCSKASALIPGVGMNAPSR